MGGYGTGPKMELVVGAATQSDLSNGPSATGGLENPACINNISGGIQELVKVDIRKRLLNGMEQL